PDQVWLRRIGGVDDRDRARALSKRDPEARLIGADRDVVCAEADEELAYHATADHSELAARVVGDVDVAAVQRARRNVGRGEATQDAAHPQRGRVDERHGAGANAGDVPSTCCAARRPFPDCFTQPRANSSTWWTATPARSPGWSGRC